MKRITKYKGIRKKRDLKERLKDYSALSKGFKNSYKEAEQLKTGIQVSSLGSLIALAATAMTPNLADGQCLVSGSGIDLDGDMAADVFISYFWWSDSGGSGSCGSSEQIYQIRVVGASGADVKFYGTGAGFPRGCYANACLFPYANGATTAPQSGTVGVIFSSVNSCSFCVVTSQNCFETCSTYTTTSGTATNCWTTCSTTWQTVTDCQPTLNRGNFPPHTTGTLAIKLNGTFYFTELELFGSPLIKTINGVTAQNCDPDGCLDTVSILGNRSIPGTTYRAENLIESDGIVLAGDSVVFKSGGEIDLKREFAVDSNAVFIAEIDPCPVALSSVPIARSPVISVELENKQGVIKWEQKDNYGIYGFEIQRSAGGQDFRKIAWVDIQRDKQLYQFEDQNIKPNTRYAYRIKQINIDGKSVISRQQYLHLKKQTEFQVHDIRTDKEQLFVDINSQLDRQLTIEVFNKNGSLIHTFTEQVFSGDNELQFAIQDLGADSHYAKIRIGNTVQYKTLEAKLVH